MLFTIAIPTYNNAKTVSKAIESAINQDYKDEYEILVVNNASTDETANIISAYAEMPKVRIVTNSETVDLFANHNVCFQEASGEYVLFIHSDDKLCENALTILDEEIRKCHYPKRFIIWGHSMMYDFQTRIEEGGQSLNQPFCGENAAACFLKGGLTPSGTCYSRKSILEIGGFPKMKSRITPHDWYVLIWAAFNYFEFEMVSRLIYIRTDYTTSASVKSSNQISTANKEMFGMLFEKFNSSQKKKFLDIVAHYGSLYLINLLKREFSYKDLLKARFRSIIRTYHNL